MPRDLPYFARCAWLCHHPNLRQDARDFVDALDAGRALDVPNEVRLGAHLLAIVPYLGCSEARLARSVLQLWGWKVRAEDIAAEQVLSEAAATQVLSECGAPQDGKVCD